MELESTGRGTGEIMQVLSTAGQLRGRLVGGKGGDGRYCVQVQHTELRPRRKESLWGC